MTNATMTWLVLTIVAGMVALAVVLQLAGRTGQPLGLRKRHWFFLALCVGLFGMAGASLFAYLTTTQRLRDLDEVGDRFMAIIGLMDALKDAERGEMGFLLTGRESYKVPFSHARPRVPQQCERLRKSYAGSDELPRVEALCRLADTKIRELDRSIALREKGEGERALALLSTDAGRNTMELIGLAGNELAGRAIAQHRAARRDLTTLAEARVVMAIVVVAGSVVCMALAVFGLMQHGPGDSSRG